MSESAIAVKAGLVEETAAKFTNAVSSVVVDVRGLTVEQSNALRKSLREEGIELKVIKNKILTRAADAANFSDLKEVFEGPSAVAFSNDDAIAPARILKEYADKIEALEIKGGVIDGTIASVEEINKYASLPSRDGLLSMLLSTLQAPVRNFAYAVKAVSDAKDEEPAA